MRTAYTDTMGEVVSRMHQQAFPNDTNLEFIGHLSGAFDFGERNGETYFHLVNGSGHILSFYSHEPQKWFCKY